VSDVECFARSAVRWNDRRIEVRFAEVDGRLICIGLEIGPHLVDDLKFVNVVEGDLRPLAATDARFPLRRIVDAALPAAVMVRAGTGDHAKDVERFNRDLGVLQRAQAEPRKRIGRPPIYSREHFEEVARVYSEHLKAGGRTPTKAVQEHFGPGVTKSTAAKWVARAKGGKYKLLPRPGQPADDG